MINVEADVEIRTTLEDLTINTSTESGKLGKGEEGEKAREREGEGERERERGREKGRGR